MFDEVDRRVEQWVTRVLPDAEVFFGLPGQLVTEPKACVRVYLLEVRQEPTRRAERRATVRMELRYLVAVEGEPLEAHRRLGALCFAALDEPLLLRPDIAPLGADMWRALGCAPRPSLSLRLTAERELAEVAAGPPVRSFELSSGPLRSLRGVLLGPGEVPMVGATVGVPQLGKRAVTDSRGRFGLHGLPLSEAVIQLDVRAKGRQWAAGVDPVSAGDEPVVVRIDPTEEPT